MPVHFVSLTKVMKVASMKMDFLKYGIVWFFVTVSGKMCGRKSKNENGCCFFRLVFRVL